MEADARSPLPTFLTAPEREGTDSRDLESRAGAKAEADVAE